MLNNNVLLCHGGGHGMTWEESVKSRVKTVMATYIPGTDPIDIGAIEYSMLMFGKSREECLEYARMIFEELTCSHA